MPINIPTGRALYYWVYGVNSATGKGAIVGPFSSEAQASEDASNLAETRVYRLPTRDHSKATRIIKAKLLKQSGPREALQRMRHKLSGEPAEIPDVDEAEF